MTLSVAQVERYQRKSRAVVGAWSALFGEAPSLRSIVRTMAVAEFETRLGDARGWGGEHNWGAIKKRGLTPLERSTLLLARLLPEGGDPALTAARQRLSPAPDEALHIDSSPGGGKHFAWFWAFPTDELAARKFLQVLVVQRPSVRAVLEHDDITAMARAMYETGYYEGFHKGDPDANIRDYARRLGEIAPVIEAALLHQDGAELIRRARANADALAARVNRMRERAVPPVVMASPREDVGPAVALFVGGAFVIFGCVLAHGAHR